MRRFSKSRGRRYYRRKARWPGVIVVCVLVCFLLVMAGPIFHVWDHWFPQPSIQANALAVETETSPEEQPFLRHIFQQDLGLEEITDKLLHLLEQQYESTVSAQGIIIMDDDRQVLYEKDADTQRAPASMTKLMTAIVMLESGCLEDTVVVGDLYSCYVDGSVLLYLEPGEQVAMRDLLAALMIMSSNDAAAAIAIHVSGSIENFAQMMNDKAEEMGLTNTHFVNPHGLTAEGHYTTPRDMAKILQEASQYEILQELSAMTEYSFSSIRANGETYTYTMESSNGFALGTSRAEHFTYICGKTGYTSAAGMCLAAAFESDAGKKYYCVVMQSESHFEDVCRTMNYLEQKLEALK
ncbi:MAG: D-alanyl-D-alanine carboxypeptidase family protein [Lachnospirales bacterium]